MTPQRVTGHVHDDFGHRQAEQFAALRDLQQKCHELYCGLRLALQQGWCPSLADRIKEWAPISGQ